MIKYKITLTGEAPGYCKEKIYVQTNCQDLENNKELLEKAIQLGSENEKGLSFYQQFGEGGDIKVERVVEREYINLDV